MALTDSTIKQVERELKNINSQINYGSIQPSKSYDTVTFTYKEGYGLYDCWNTFQYVAKNLKEWANDTTIGLATKENLINLSNYLIQVIEETRSITKRLEVFCEQQRKINQISAEYERETEDYNSKLESLGLK